MTLLPLFSYGLVPEKPRSGNEYFQSGEFSRTHSEYDKALREFQNAAERFSSEHQDSSYAVAQNRASEILLLISRNDEASTILKNNEAFITSHWGKMNELYCVCVDLIGDYFMSFSDAEAARIYYDRVYQIRLKLFGQDDVHTAYSMAQIASYYNFKITMDSAFFFAQKAYSICQQEQTQTHLIDEVKVISTYAYAYKIYKGHLPEESDKARVEARKIYQTAINKVRKTYGFKSLKEAGLYRSIGNTYTDQIGTLYYTQRPFNKSRLRDLYFKRAKEYYAKSEAMIRNVAGASHPDLSTVYFVTSLLYQYAYQTDSIKQALNFINSALQIILPSGTSAEKIDELNIRKCVYKYDLMTLLHAKAGCLQANYVKDSATSVLHQIYETEKLRILLWQHIIRDFSSPFPNRLMLIYNGSLFSELNYTAWRLYMVEKKSSYYSDLFLFSEWSKKSLRGKLLLQAGVSQKEKQYLQIATIDEIQSALPDKNTLFIEFHGEHTAIGITKDKVVATHLDSIGGDSLLRYLKQSMVGNDPVGYCTTAYTLYNKFLKPVTSQYSQHFSRLIIVPDGYLTYIPFGALISDSKNRSMDFRSLPYLINEVSVSYELSGTDFINETHHVSSGNGRILGFAPSFENRPLLPFSSDLLTNVANKYECDLFQKSEATITNFIRNAGNYSFIHLATHADTTARPRLYFSEATALSNSLPLDSIYFLPMKADLSILAACNTSSGTYEYGEGTLSFARAFLTAGCKSAISTIWSVDDKATSELLSNFYSGISDDLEKDEALRTAQLRYLQKCKSSREASPFYWSGIILTGDHSPIHLDGKNRMTIIVSTGLFLLLLLFIYYRKK